MEEVKSWGYHLLANFAGCAIDKITSKENVENFSTDLVEAIDMVAYGEPQVVNFGTGNKAGFTLVQLIDVFSCKPFDPDVAIRVFVEYFEPKGAEFDFVERQAPTLT
jgi:S-adenosylmethionine/arginine decarboxylase-like enzyme